MFLQLLIEIRHIACKLLGCLLEIDIDHALTCTFREDSSEIDSCASAQSDSNSKVFTSVNSAVAPLSTEYTRKHDLHDMQSTRLLRVIFKWLEIGKNEIYGVSESKATRDVAVEVVKESKVFI